jgi:hypothetical protein
MSRRIHCWSSTVLPFNGDLTIYKVSQPEGFRHLHPAPCIVPYATPRFVTDSSVLLEGDEALRLNAPDDP